MHPGRGAARTWGYYLQELHRLNGSLGAQTILETVQPLISPRILKSGSSSSPHCKSTKSWIQQLGPRAIWKNLFPNGDSFKDGVNNRVRQLFQIGNTIFGHGIHFQGPDFGNMRSKWSMDSAAFNTYEGTSIYGNPLRLRLTAVGTNLIRRLAAEFCNSLEVCFKRSLCLQTWASKPRRKIKTISFDVASASPMESWIAWTQSWKSNSFIAFKVIDLRGVIWAHEHEKTREVAQVRSKKEFSDQLWL